MRFAYAPPHPRAGGGRGAWGREYIQREDGLEVFLLCVVLFP